MFVAKQVCNTAIEDGLKNAVDRMLAQSQRSYASSACGVLSGARFNMSDF